MHCANYYGHSGVKEAVTALSSGSEYTLYMHELNTRQERREVQGSSGWGSENIEIPESAEVTLLENRDRQCLK